MKTYIVIPQRQIVELGLHEQTDLIDWAIISYIKDFYISPKAQKIIVDEQHYCWINYRHLIESMPLMHISDKSNISRRIKKLVDIGLLEKCNGHDNTIYVRLTDMCCQVFIQSEPVAQTDTKLRSGNVRVVPQQHVCCSGTTAQYNNNQYIDNKYIIPPTPPNGGESECTKTPSSKEQKNEEYLQKTGFYDFWEKYPRKINKNYCKKIWLRNKFSEDDLKSILSALESLKRSDLWQRGIGIWHPSTFLNQRIWEDEYINEVKNDPKQAEYNEAIERINRQEELYWKQKQKQQLEGEPDDAFRTI